MKYTWVPIYIFIISYLFFNIKKGAWLTFIIIILTVVTADITSSHLIKKNVKRIRPCNVENLYTIERVPCGSGYSFTSSHAANHFALSLILIMTIAKRKRVKLLLWSWAIVIAFSQVYVGVHYPLDVIVGGLLGCFIAFLYFKVYEQISYSKISTQN
jgi:undecaprenyl-diphosphatase